MDRGHKRNACGNWQIRLYVAGATPKCIRALTNLKRICSEHLENPYRIEVVDLLLKPHRAQAEGIVAIPTVIRDSPPPRKRLIGDLANRELALAGLGITAKPVPVSHHRSPRRSHQGLSRDAQDRHR